MSIEHLRSSWEACHLLNAGCEMELVINGGIQTRKGCTCICSMLALILKENDSEQLHRDALNNGCANSPFALLVLCFYGRKRYGVMQKFSREQEGLIISL